MQASEHFGIRRGPADDWFDPILNADTRLFIDPFLIFKEPASTRWSRAHGKLVSHFDRAFSLIAEGNLNRKSLQYKKALATLTFHEPSELCLGYTAYGTQGLGSGSGYAELIAQAISDAIRRGIKHPRHFEELGILNEGIGADRISDITSTILKSMLVEYTQDIVRQHGLATQPQRLYAAGFDDRRLRWEAPIVQLPFNPYNGKPLLFVPERFLRDLPSLNPYDWWDSHENESLRDDLNYEIMGHVTKAVIVEAARNHPESVRRWTIQKERQPATPYNFAQDPEGVWSWDHVTSRFATRNPAVLRSARTFAEFEEVITTVIAQYRLFVEEQGGWSLLWRQQGSEKPEHAAQLLFRGIASHYCKANDISLDPEVNLGRGPVDFKFSSGFSKRAHLEIKKLHNGKFWNGLNAQLPSYMTSDEVRDGWFLSIRYRDGDQWDDREQDLSGRVRDAATRTGLRLRFATVDARPKKSASNL